MATAKQKAAARRNLVKARAAARTYGYRGYRGRTARVIKWLDSGTRR